MGPDDVNISVSDPIDPVDDSSDCDLDSEIEAPVRQLRGYSHGGKRRRRITEDLFRCTAKLRVVKDLENIAGFDLNSSDNGYRVNMGVAGVGNSLARYGRSEGLISCGALIWRTPEKMRDHLKFHLIQEDIDKLSDEEIRGWYKDAARIAQEGIPDDDNE